MKEIITNTCYGGFSISRKALLALRELNNKHALEETAVGEYFSDGSGPLEEDLLGNSYCRDIPRDDPDLVKVVKMLGTEANGSYASLSIIEIPDDVDWEIQENDGQEWVAEKHRVWY